MKNYPPKNLLRLHNPSPTLFPRFPLFFTGSNSRRTHACRWKQSSPLVAPLVSPFAVALPPNFRECTDSSGPSSIPTFVSLAFLGK
ncbi:hypothetical protein Csa_018167 [Cucumis sativus]|uniref:Uncharacterized protein n=1 Tax=Cucumis sativus TaxID=3659 RepID=A0A0A0KXG7_CUCSA|nr:hypothetical protein Csa_018167 [Cucumis sativus]